MRQGEGRSTCGGQEGPWCSGSGRKGEAGGN
uniref:Uncharacterized protein n=1 Tax=Arundo donax TaxID=35708 RepID=A0A0A9AVZ5_ARUDO